MQRSSKLSCAAACTSRWAASCQVPRRRLQDPALTLPSPGTWLLPPAVQPPTHTGAGSVRGEKRLAPRRQERESIGAIAPWARGHTRARAAQAVPPGGWDGAGTAMTQREAAAGRFCAGASPLPFHFGSLPFCAQALLQGVQPPIPAERTRAGGSSHSPHPAATFLGPDPREPPPCPSAPSSHGRPSPPSFPLPGLNGLLRTGGGCSRAAFVECSQWSVTCKQISAIM